MPQRTLCRQNDRISTNTVDTETIVLLTPRIMNPGTRFIHDEKTEHVEKIGEDLEETAEWLEDLFE